MKSLSSNEEHSHKERFEINHLIVMWDIFDVK